MLLVTGLTLVGEGLNDIVNPLLRVRGYRGKAGEGAAPTSAGGPRPGVAATGATRPWSGAAA